MPGQSTLTVAQMQAFTFGVEIETIHLSRERLAQVVAQATGGTTRYVGDSQGYDKWIVTLPDGRVWTCMSDASITGGRHGSNGEVVTPICTYADMDMIQNVCRALYKAGARTDLSCGIHVHVGAAGLATTADGAEQECLGPADWHHYQGAVQRVERKASHCCLCLRHKRCVGQHDRHVAILGAGCIDDRGRV